MIILGIYPLKLVNPNFEPITLTCADEGELQVLAELVAVLGTEITDEKN